MNQEQAKGAADVTQGVGPSLLRGLGRTILVWFFVVALVPLAVVSTLNYLGAYRGLRTAVLESLEAVADIKTAYIRSHFEGLLTHLEEESESTANARFLEDLIQGLRESGLEADRFTRGYEWELLVHRYAGDLNTIKKLHGFYDILLIDAKGNVLFTVMREHDLGANLFRGGYAETLLAWACRKSLETGRPVFSDFDFYEPSSRTVAGFMVAPILNAEGDKIGLIALQVPVHRIDAIMQVTSGLGKTGESYLVGPDLSMRSNSIRSDMPTILGDAVDTEQTRLWLRHSGEAGLSARDSSLLSYRGYRGAQVIGTHQPLEIAGVRLGVIAEIEEAEAFAPIKSQRDLALAVGLAALLVLCVSALLVTQSIVTPIHALRKGTAIIGRGDLTHRVGTDAQDEIGQLSRAFDDMVDRLRTVMASRDDLDREVAQRQRAERGLRQTLRNLERSNRDLEQFAYSASHDLQEPLRKVMAFGSLLRSEYGEKVKGDGEMYVNAMLNATERMQRLIRDLLEYSRVSTRGDAFSVVDLNDTLRGVLSDLELRIKEAGGTVDVADLPKLQADPTQMRQLLQNLIGNALKFHKDGAAPRVKVYSEAVSEKEVRIFVEDCGIGFDEKFKERIFGVFQRLHSRQEYGGSGIGLAICRRIVERHGGAITTISSPGEGTRFIIRLPVEQVKEEWEQ